MKSDVKTLKSDINKFYKERYYARAVAAIPISLTAIAFAIFLYARRSPDMYLLRIVCFAVLCIINLACDNSGLRTGLCRILFKDKIISKWLQRENKGWSVVTEALKTAVYFLFSIYIFFDEGKPLLLLWVLIVALNIIMYLRYVIKKEFLNEEREAYLWTIHRSMGITGVMFLLYMFKRTEFSLMMVLLIVAMVAVFSLILFITIRKRGVSKFDITTTILVLIVFFVGTVFSANHFFDYNNTKVCTAHIALKYSEEFILSRHNRERYVFEIPDWNGENKHHKYIASQLDYKLYNVGDEIEIRQGEGVLGGRWYEYKTFEENVMEEQENGTQKD